MKLHALLSKRETQVAELLAWGASKKEVASRLFVSTRTVENTARNIYAKLGIQKATELCVWWFCTNYPASFGFASKRADRKRRFVQNWQGQTDSTGYKDFPAIRRG